MNTDAERAARRPWLIAGAILEAVMLMLTVLALYQSDRQGDRTSGDPAVGDHVEDAAGSGVELSHERLMQLASAHDPIAYLSREVLGATGMELVAKGIITPSGDTVLMRHLGLAPVIPYAIVQRFQAVALSGDEEFRLRELGRLAEEPIPEVRYRALLERVRTVLRGSAGRLSEAAAADLDRALTVDGVDARLTVDALYFKAVQFEQDGKLEQARAAINRALDTDAVFLWAHWKRVAITAALLDENAQRLRGVALRRQLVGELIRSLNHVTALTRGANAVHDLMRAAGPLGESSDPNALFAFGYVHLVTGHVARAREILARIEEACAVRADRCVPEVASATAALLRMTRDKT